MFADVARRSGTERAKSIPSLRIQGGERASNATAPPAQTLTAIFARQSAEHCGADYPNPRPCDSSGLLPCTERHGCGARGDSEGRALRSSEPSLSLLHARGLPGTAGDAARLGGIRGTTVLQCLAEGAGELHGDNDSL
eukprot:6169855-Pleurochrysis_carterae.AAC.1